MRVSELMTEKVLTIGPEAPIKDVAKVLISNGISGLPVCDIEGRVLGVISEGDILYKEHDPREGHVGGPLGWIIDGTPNYAGVAKAKALTARKAMTSPAITIAPWEPAATAAQIMCERHVNRLPVVKDGLLVGIVTRADLVRAFARSDEEIEREIQDLVLHTLWIEEPGLDVRVERGEVRLSGKLGRRSDAELLPGFVTRVPGVVTVHSTLRWGWDDRKAKDDSRFAGASRGE
jgi:CBS domain-containing protein